MESLARELYVAGRSLLRNKKFAFLAVTLLVLGIGSSIALVSILDLTVIYLLLFLISGCLVDLKAHWKGGVLVLLSHLDFLDIGVQNISLEKFVCVLSTYDFLF